MDKHQIGSLSQNVGDTNAWIFLETPFHLVQAARVLSGEATIDYSSSRRASARSDGLDQAPWFIQWHEISVRKLGVAREWLIGAPDEGRAFTTMSPDYCELIREMTDGQLYTYCELVYPRALMTLRETMGLNLLATSTVEGASQEDLLMARMAHAAAINGRPAAGAAL